MTFSFADKPNALALLQTALDEAENSTDQFGKFATAYDFLFVLISVDSSGNPILDENDLADPSFLDTFNINDYSVSEFQPAAGVDEGAWIFLRGVSDVNLGPANPDGETNYSKFIREYSAEQFRTRFGENEKTPEELAVAIQEASDGIAQNILEDILNLDPENPNPNHELPTIDDIAGQDAEAAAEDLFTDGQIAGWAGNPFLLAVGHDDSYRANILHDPDFGGDGNLLNNLLNTYDILSVVHAVQHTMDVVGITATGSLIFDVLTDVIGEVPGAASTITAVANDTDAFLENVYGESLPLADLAFDNIILGTKNSDRVADSLSSDNNEDDIVHSGLGDDHIIGSFGDDLIDGGSGIDNVSYQNITANIINPTNGLTVTYEDVSGAYAQRLVVNGGAGIDNSTMSFFGAFTDFVYGVEKIIGTEKDDTFIYASTAEQSDSITFAGGLGNDTYTMTGPGDLMIEEQNSLTIATPDNSPARPFFTKSNIGHDVLDLSSLTEGMTLTYGGGTVGETETGSTIVSSSDPAQPFVDFADGARLDLSGIEEVKLGAGDDLLVTGDGPVAFGGTEGLAMMVDMGGNAGDTVELWGDALLTADGMLHAENGAAVSGFGQIDLSSYGSFFSIHDSTLKTFDLGQDYVASRGFYSHWVDYSDIGGQLTFNLSKSGSTVTDGTESDSFAAGPGVNVVGTDLGGGESDIHIAKANSAVFYHTGDGNPSLRSAKIFSGGGVPLILNANLSVRSVNVPLAGRIQQKSARSALCGDSLAKSAANDNFWACRAAA